MRDLIFLREDQGQKWAKRSSVDDKTAVDTTRDACFAALRRVFLGDTVIPAVNTS